MTTADTATTTEAATSTSVRMAGRQVVLTVSSLVGGLADSPTMLLVVTDADVFAWSVPVHVLLVHALSFVPCDDVPSGPRRHGVMRGADMASCAGMPCLA
ncbi:hypothetical protein ABZ642_36160 [Streptomyces sp. NPDC007157]|uniref:hypothetical protein n=1 Tax=Streptomyces sp. NPDC007157 TaxID=3154681 RepID=UPI00340827B2